MVPSASIPAVRQNLSKLTETASQALSTAPSPVGGKAVNGVIAFFMALLSFRGISMARFLLVHIGDPSSNQATTLESQMIHMIQELFGQTLRADLALVARCMSGGGC